MEEIALKRPTSAPALLSIKGIGPAKLERYGEALLALVGRHPSDDDSLQREPAAVTAPPSVPTVAAASDRQTEAPDEPPTSGESTPSPEGAFLRLSAADRPSYYWTWRLLSAGFSPEECQAIRGISRQVMLDHLLRAVDEGLPVQPERCLDAELLAALEREVGADARPPIRSLLGRLPAGTRYAEVQLFLKCRGRASPG